MPARSRGRAPTAQHCIYALDPSMPSAFRADSSAQLDANCGLMVNSTSSSGMHTTSSANVTASVVNVHGNFVKESSSVINPTPNTYVDTERIRCTTFRRPRLARATT